MKIKSILILAAIFPFTFGEAWGVATFAQNVGINTTGNAPNSSALLDVNASPGNNKGILIPRLPLTATNVGAPISPAPGAGETGLMVFNTATAGVPPNDVVPGFYYWNGTAWAPLGAGGSTSGGWTDDGTVVRLTTSTDFVGIGTASPAATSALDIASTTKGLLIPRMTTAQRDAISTPAIGLQIYNTDCKVVDYWSGSCWIAMSKSLPSPGAITSSGTTVFCAGQSRTYTIAAIAGATSYTWTVPAGTTINSGQGTVSISATFGNISGNVCVNANNACETSGQSCLAVSVDPIPNTPGNITGPSSINPGQQSVNYFIASVNGASAYTWSYSGTGLTIASGTGTTSIVANFACNATAGNLTVTANSTCGASTAATLAVTVTPLLSASAGANLTGPGAIGGSPTATGGTSTYTYAWSPTSGLSSSTAANPTATACTTTTYTVTATDSRSCTATSSVTVTKNLTASAGANTTGPGVVIGGAPTAAGGAGSYTYSWNPTSNLSSSTIANPTANNCTITTYTVTVTDANSCTAVSAGVTVTPVTPSQIAYTTPGTYSWTCPANVFSVCVVAVGGGGGGGYQWSSGGGGGGGLGWKNNISVTPGTAYTVVVGVGGAIQPNAYNAGTEGGNSYFISLATVAGYGSGRGGTLGVTTVSPAYGGGYNGDGGGSGGHGAISGSWTHAGAGAGGYAGTGGSLYSGAFQGTGGAGAGGGYYSSTYGVSAGGGTGLLGQGASGTTRYDPANGWASTYGGGNGGSGGARGRYGEYNGGTNECGGTQCITGGAPGGGGGGSGTSWGGGAGGAGGVRIIWGCGRSFPSTSTGDM